MKKLIFILVIIAVNLLSAEIIAGFIIDQESGKPVESAFIKLDNRIFYSNKTGEFTFYDLEEGSYILEIRRIGYQTKIKKLNVPYPENLIIELQPESYLTEGIKIVGTRAEYRETPVTFTNIDNEMISEKNVGQDIPLLLSDMPNLLSYSESGSGVGYSYLKVRGFDQCHVGVMINGIPLNDPEDHQVYWVNMPDFAESLEDIQFQRGVGSSQYGISTFGGSVNFETSNVSTPERTEIYSNVGSFQTIRYGIKTAKKINSNYTANFRLSRVESEGYRDNSASENWAFLSAFSRIGNSSVTELNFYGGNEKTHASWYASSQPDLEENHHHNPIEYDNEIDDFSQPHLEVHHSYFFNRNLDMKNTLFYIHGDGYYEQCKDGEDLWEYGLADSIDEIQSDLIRQKWVKKNQYGWISKLAFKHKRGKFTFGTYISLFDSRHWGEVFSLESEGVNIPDFEKNFEYYNYTGDKKYFTVYANEQFSPFAKMNVMANLHFQKIDYRFEQNEAGNFVGKFLNSYEVDYNFLNPRFGLNYNLSETINTYANLSFAHKEPADDELFDTWDGPDDLGITPLFAESESIANADGDTIRIEWSKPYVKPEKLINYELGFAYLSGIWNAKLNLFLMDFRDEIIPYGRADDEGNPIRGNAEKTIHRGIEFSLKTELPLNLYFSGNVSYNDNYFRKFIMHDWDENWDPVQIDFSGNKIAGFPDILGNASLSYKIDSLILSTQTRYIGKQYLDNSENEDRIIDPSLIFNAQIIVKLMKEEKLEFSLRINNILNEIYETAGYYDAWAGENFYFPAAERNIMAGIRVGF